MKIFVHYKEFLAFTPAVSMFSLFHLAMAVNWQSMLSNNMLSNGMEFVFPMDLTIKDFFNNNA